MRCVCMHALRADASIPARAVTWPLRSQAALLLSMPRYGNLQRCLTQAFLLLLSSNRDVHRRPNMAAHLLVPRRNNQTSAPLARFSDHRQAGAAVTDDLTRRPRNLKVMTPKGGTGRRRALMPAGKGKPSGDLWFERPRWDVPSGGCQMSVKSGDPVAKKCNVTESRCGHRASRA